MNVKELLSLKKKIILVTGGAGFYGQCLVEGLAEADGTVITASRNLDALQKLADEFKRENLDVHAVRLDQADHASVKALAEHIQDEFGGLDVFVNNAVSRPMENYDAPLEQFAESMRVNATGMIDITREMAALIAARGGGSIIQISSMFGMFGPDLSNYVGTTMSQSPPPDYFFHNAGLLGLTHYLARLYADKKIRVNAISPGGLFSGQPEVFLKNYNSKVPVGRMANRDDIKGLAVLLASDASAYINGENILMDGGMHA